MKLKTKLLGSFTIVLLLTVAIGITGLVVALNVNKAVKSLSENWLPSIGYLSQVDTSTSELRWNQLRLITLPNRQKEATADIRTSLSEIKANMDKYAPTISLDEEKKAWETISQDYDTILKTNDNILNYMASGKNLAAMNEYDASKINYDDMKNSLNTLLDLNKKNGINEATVTDNTVKVGQVVQISVTLLAIILGLVVSLFMAFSLTKSIKRLSDALETVANGDLTLANLNNKSKDELGIMARAFDKMVENLRMIVKQVVDSSQHLGASSEELSAASEEASASSEQISATIGQLASGASDQAKSVDDASMIINKLSSSAQQVAANAETVSQSSEKVAQAAQLGVHQAENAVEKIDAIKRVSAETAEVISIFGNQSQQIGEIVTVIKGIADQTNLLALNAAIEAARAGEQGRGFAVVAEEVRKLSEQSSTSAQQIATLIGNILRETDRAVRVMEKGTTEVAAGVEAVNSAGTAFQTIVSEIDLVVEQIRHVSESTQQMAQGTNEAVQSIMEIGAISEQTAGSAQEVSAASEEQTATMESVSKSAQDLASLGEQLTGLVAAFKIN